MDKEPNSTTSFKIEREGKERVDTVLRAVYQALQEKGYNPINQLVGYMISGDPAYITSYKNARSLICQLERDEILEELLQHYLK